MKKILLVSMFLWSGLAFALSQQSVDKAQEQADLKQAQANFIKARFDCQTKFPEASPELVACDKAASDAYKAARKAIKDRTKTPDKAKK